MKLGLAARDVRVLALLLALGLSAAVLVVTSWPERDELRQVEDAESAPVAESTSSPARRIPEGGRRVATRWAEAYFTTTSSDSAAARRRRLEPYSSDELVAEMRIDSGALTLHKRNSKSRATSVAKVVALQEQDGTPGHALVAVVERTMTGGEKKSTELVTVTLELVQEHGAWLVTEVLVP